VETAGGLLTNEPFDGGRRLAVGTDVSAVSPDDSIAVQGVCLTAERAAVDPAESLP